MQEKIIIKWWADTDQIPKKYRNDDMFEIVRNEATERINDALINSYRFGEINIDYTVNLKTKDLEFNVRGGYEISYDVDNDKYDEFQD